MCSIKCFLIREPRLLVIYSEPKKGMIENPAIARWFLAVCLTAIVAKIDDKFRMRNRKAYSGAL